MEIRSKFKQFIVRKWGDICRRSHYVVMAIPFLLVIGALTLTVASIVRINQILDGQSFQYAAEMYETSSSNYRQLMVLSESIPQDDGSAPHASANGLNLERVQQIHDSLELIESSSSGGNYAMRTSGQATSSESVWKDCYASSAYYSAQGYIDKNATGSVESCEVVGVGGDYAVIHPFRYESGGFLADDESGRYSIVLNNQLAWNLFHSYNVTGATVNIGGTVFYVSGVVCEGDDAIAETTGVTKPRAYIQFRQLASLANGSSIPSTSMDQEDAVSVDDLAVMSYEVLLLDPINNIAYNDLISAMGDSIGYSEGNESLQIVNNTGRFGAIKLWKKYFPLKNAYAGYDGMHIPFYERSARLAEQYVVFWAEMLIVSIVVLILGGCNIYAIFHGRHTKHALVEEEEESETLPDIHRV